jgi:hypothetical protein
LTNGLGSVILSSIRSLVCLFLIGLPACDSGIDPSEVPEFAIYRLKDANLIASQLWNQPLENLVLADAPLVALKDVKSYRWQTHEFTVTAAVDSQLAAISKTLGPIGGIPFVVTVGNEKVYLGAFWYPHSSLAPQVPYIDVMLNPHRICPRWSGQGDDDKRNDPRISRALKMAGVLIE